MFQFPGFALKDLCIQSLSTWLSPLLITRGNNNELSGGFPHSEIHGSKPIPGSPWLIAGYHVFHRLLLPRHPPNALLALDLIQKKTVQTVAVLEAGNNRHPYSEPKSKLSRSQPCRWPGTCCAILRLRGLVYLTWTTLSFQRGRPRYV